MMFIGYFFFINLLLVSKNLFVDNVLKKKMNVFFFLNFGIINFKIWLVIALIF